MSGKALSALQASDEVMSSHDHIGARAGIHTFRHDMEAKDMFCALDVSQVRAPMGYTGAAFEQQFFRIASSERSIMAQHLCSTLESSESP